MLLIGRAEIWVSLVVPILHKLNKLIVTAFEETDVNGQTALCHIGSDNG